ncbi:MAG: hypothetical protein U9P68_00815 [Pseudomonadota bacterium]|nr:hypothetical protein [Pseudomonadota bacterium]
MADPNETLDPEPVDAEFEPADDSGTAGQAERKGPGWLSLFTVFLLASAAGGALGYAGHAYLDNTPRQDAGAADERAALTEAISRLETRLDTAEADDPAAGLNDRLDALEARIEAAADTPAGAPDLSGIEARLSRLEDAPASGTADPFDPSPLENRIDALDSMLADVEALANQALDDAQANAGSGVDPLVLQNITDRLAALEQAQDQAGPGFDDPAPRIEALEARIAAFEDEVSALRQDLADTRELAETTSRNAAQTDGEDARASRTLAARALALTALRDMAGTGEGFEAERAALARVWRDNEDIVAMADTARAGVPTLDQLAQDFPGAAIREAAGPGRVFFGLVEVRQSEAGDDETGAMAITALAEDRLAQDDLDGAIALAERLEGDALDAARDWLISARARQTLDARLARLRQALTGDVSAQEEDPS